MKHPLSLCIAMVAVACSTPSEPDSTAPPTAHSPLLPAAPTASERQGKADGWDPRDDEPELYGFTTPPSEPVTLPGEFESANGLLIGWSNGAGALRPFFVDLITASSDSIPVQIYIDPSVDMQGVTSDLSWAGADMDQIEFRQLDLDSIWMRDYGPLVVHGDSGTEYVIDGRYYWGRWSDDYMPTAFAVDTERAVSRPPIEIEGGNLLSDGSGQCVTTEALVWRNSGFGYGQSDVAEILADYYGCQATTFVPPMLGEGTGHVDMHVHLIGEAAALVGQYTPDQDSENAYRLDETATRLEAAGFEVTRIPMPDNDDRTVFRSYTNALAIGDTVLVPVYDEDASFESEALELFEGAFAGRTIVPVDADEIIQWSGAVHCVTMTF